MQAIMNDEAKNYRSVDSIDIRGGATVPTYLLLHSASTTPHTVVCMYDGG